ncbi:MAG TPA: hypothetical protein VGJ34_11530 [Gaiellaceae bacterium]
MKRLPIDADTADRLLAGSVAPEDAPPGYARVAVMLATAAGEEAGDELRREEETVAVVGEIVRSSETEKPRPPRRSFVPRLKLATAFATVALAGTTGLAFAGSLPGAAQDVASAMLAKVGVSVPNDNAGDHPNIRSNSSETPSVSSSGKGDEISGLATTTDLTGVEKGAEISTVASEGKSRAGEEHEAPVATPNAGGTGTADTASDGNSTDGTASANTASHGHSAAGSENAAAGQSNKP